MRRYWIGLVAGACAAGLIAVPAQAKGKHNVAGYKDVKVSANGTYTFTETVDYPDGAKKSTTYTIRFEGKGGKLYLGAGDRYGWPKAITGPVDVTYSHTETSARVAWDPCFAFEETSTGSWSGTDDIGVSGPTRHPRAKEGKRTIRLVKDVTLGFVVSVPLTVVTKRTEASGGGCATTTETTEGNANEQFTMKGKLKGKTARLTAVLPDGGPTEGTTQTVSGEATVKYSRNPAFRW